VKQHNSSGEQNGGEIYQRSAPNLRAYGCHQPQRGSVDAIKPLTALDHLIVHHGDVDCRTAKTVAPRRKNDTMTNTAARGKSSA